MGFPSLALVPLHLVKYFKLKLCFQLAISTIIYPIEKPLFTPTKLTQSTKSDISTTDTPAMDPNAQQGSAAGGQEDYLDKGTYTSTCLPRVD